MDFFPENIGRSGFIFVILQPNCTFYNALLYIYGRQEENQDSAHLRVSQGWAGRIAEEAERRGREVPVDRRYADIY